MKKRIQGIVAGFVAGTLAVSGSVFAKQASEMAEIFYNNIKIFIDGGEIVPKDANGNIVEPFIYNGTTYLPVRAVSNAFGKEVLWDGETQSVYIGKKDSTKPDNYLHKIQYNDYKEVDGDFSIINGTITDFDNITYTNGLLFYRGYSGGINKDIDPDVYDFMVSYPLNSQYNKLVGKIVLPKKFDTKSWGSGDCQVSEADVLIYGDGELLYRATNVTSSLPFDFDIKVKGINQLVLKVKTGRYNHVALTDLALYK